MTLLFPHHLTCCSSDGCSRAWQGGPVLSSRPPQAGRRAAGSRMSVPCFSAGDKTTVPCHHSADKTRLLFTDHTSTLNHLMQGSSKACWVDNTPRKTDLYCVRSKHINDPVKLAVCTGCGKHKLECFIIIFLNIFLDYFTWHQHADKQLKCISC